MVVQSPDRTSAVRLTSVDVGSATFTPVPAPDVAGCARTEISNPTSAARQMLASRVCVYPLGSGEPDTTTIVTVDLESATYEQRASLGDLRNPAGAIAPNPDGSRMLMAMGSLCGVIVEATPDGPVPLDVTVSDGSEAFSLADTAPGPDCHQRGWADWPAWSPDGAQIAFFAAPSAIGLDGPARASVPAGLYAMAPDSGAAVRILGEDVIVPRDLAWSPDGRYLAFGGTIGDRKATWLFEPATGDLRAVHDQSFSWLAWSPDGSQLAGIELVDSNDPLIDQIVIVHVDQSAEPTIHP